MHQHPHHNQGMTEMATRFFGYFYFYFTPVCPGGEVLV